MNHANNAKSTEIFNIYSSLPRSSQGVLKQTIVFDQEKFINKNRTYAEGLKDKLDKPLLQDHDVENAAKKGYCSAAVLHWLNGGSIPSPSENMVAKLSKVQGSFDLDNERDFLTWCSNVSDHFPNLKGKKIKDSKDANLKDPQTFIDYLLDDDTHDINKKYKLFLILVFNNHTSHAVGLNLATNAFFDPNYGVYAIERPSDGNAAKGIANTVIGLEEISNKYKGVIGVRAITY